MTSPQPTSASASGSLDAPPASLFPRAGSPFGSRLSNGGGSTSDHSRHSSGYASSLGVAPGGPASSASTSGAGGAGTGAGLGAPPTQRNHSSPAAASLSPYSALTDEAVEAAIAAATRMGASSSGNGSQTNLSSQQVGGNGLPRPPYRSSLSDTAPSPFGMGLPASPVHSAFGGSASGAGGSVGSGSASSSAYPSGVPVSMGTSGPLSASDPRTQLYVSNLPYRVRWQDLKDLFRKAGTVLRADVSLTPDNRSRGHGTVLLASEEDALRAVEMFRGFSWQGRTLEVRIDRSGTLLTPEGGPSTAVAAQSPLLGVPGIGGHATNPTLAVAPTSPSPFGSLGGGGGRAGGSNAPSPRVSGGSGNLGLGANASATAAGLSQFSPLPPPAQLQANQQQQQQTALNAFGSTGTGLLGQQGSAGFGGAAAGGVNAGFAGLPAGFGTSGVAGTGGQSSYPGSRRGSQFSAGVGGAPSGNAFNQTLPQQAQQQFQAQQAQAALNAGISPALLPFLNSTGVGVGGGRASVSGATGALGAAHGPQPTGGYGMSGSGPGWAGGTVSSPYASASTAAVPPRSSSFSGPSGGGRNSSAYLGPPLPPGQTTLPPANSYYGRVLFVGNLPFHCQWQDLKDLFRTAGNIQRADVALSPEGRSRGFGTVLFASQEDAQNAVRIYHGYEYSGRTLKVHFDRFAQMTAPVNGALPASPGQYTGAFSAANPPSAPVASQTPAQLQALRGAQGTQPRLTQQPQSQINGGFNAYGQPHHAPTFQQQQQHAQNQHQQQLLAQRQQAFGGAGGVGTQGFGGAGFGINAGGAASYLGGAPQQQQPAQAGLPGLGAGAGATGAMSFASDPQSFSAFGASAPSAIGAGGVGLGDANAGAQQQQQQHPGAQGLQQPGQASQGHAGNQEASNAGSAGASSTARPGHIALPPMAFPTAGAGAGAGFSPMQRGINAIPMTPGMPGFTFHAIPQTPPVFPHQFLSPGLGPFSPPLGSPHIGGPATPGAHSGPFNPLINPAPGAPVHMGSSQGATTPGAAPGFNPLFPPVYGYGTAGVGAGSGQQQQQPQQQQGSGLPPTPHWSVPQRPKHQQHQQHRDDQESAAGQDTSTDSAATNDAPHADSEGGSRANGHAGAATDGAAQDDDDGASAGTDGAAAVGGKTSSSSSTSEGYPFPLVPSAQPLQRRASTNSPAGTPLVGPGGAVSGSSANAPQSPGWERRGSLASKAEAVAAGVPASSAALAVAAGTSSEELTRAIARMSVKGTALAKREAGSPSKSGASAGSTTPASSASSRHPLAQAMSLTSSAEGFGRVTPDGTPTEGRLTSAALSGSAIEDQTSDAS